MQGSQGRFRLRSYLLAFLVPLSVLPLLLLAGLSQVFIQSALDQEVQKRARPEVSAFARNLDNLEKRLIRSSAQLVRADEFKLALLTHNEAETERLLRRWLDQSVFDSVRAYSHRGPSLGVVARREGQSLAPAWKQLFVLPGSQAATAGLQREALNSARRMPLDTFDETDRNPAEARGRSQERARATPATAPVRNFTPPESRFERSGSLAEDFRRFLVRENYWVTREASKLRVFEGEKQPESSFKIHVYRVVYDSDFRPAGYIEGIVTLDRPKWAHLSRYQGVEFVLVDRDRSVLAASNLRTEPVLKARLGSWDQIETASEAQLPSQIIDVGNSHVEYFFAPLINELSDTIAWVGVGISRADQAALRQKILFSVAGITVLLAILVIFLTLALSERITRPISDLVQAVESVKAGAPAPTLVADSSSELGYLTERFNEMAMSVQAAKRMLETKLDEVARTNTALTNMQDQLVQSAKMSSLGQLVAGVAHELNNPIAFIYSNMVQMKQYLKNIERLDALIHDMEARADPATRARMEALLADIEWDYIRGDMADIIQSCLEGSVRVKDIVIGLRNFSRLDKGEFTEADLNASLRNTAKLLSGQIKDRVQIDWELCDESLVRCNASQVNQVFMNIMANAVQAIEGEGQLWVRTEAVNRDGRPFLRISIQDNGQGMPPEVLRRIYDPFFTTKSVGEGTGLGLSIVYGIIEKHEGSLEVRSVVFPEPTHGTVFDIYLPKEGPSVDTELDQAS
jgi:signal transduction histidine kinase